MEIHVFPSPFNDDKPFPVWGAQLAKSINDACKTTFEVSRAAGWWFTKGVDNRHNPYCFSNKIALVHSELSESLEGDRKDTMDTHLPHRKAREVEIADAVIRLFDLAGAYDMDLGGAIVEKMAYNLHREDHKMEVRTLNNGKKY